MNLKILGASIVMSHITFFCVVWYVGGWTALAIAVMVGYIFYIEETKYDEAKRSLESLAATLERDRSHRHGDFQSGQETTTPPEG